MAEKKFNVSVVFTEGVDEDQVLQIMLDDGINLKDAKGFLKGGSFSYKTPKPIGFVEELKQKYSSVAEVKTEEVPPTPEEIEAERLAEQKAREDALVGRILTGIKFPEQKPVNLQPVIDAVKQIKIPEPVDLTSLTNQLSETDKKVNELVVDVIGDEDNPGVKTLVGDLADNVEEKWGLVKKWAIGIVAGLAIVIGLLVWIAVKPAPTAKIDQKALQSTVQTAVQTAVSGLSVSAPAVNLDNLAAKVVQKMKDQKLVVPAATTGSSSGSTSSEETPAVSGKRGGKH